MACAVKTNDGDKCTILLFTSFRLSTHCSGVHVLASLFTYCLSQPLPFTSSQEQPVHTRERKLRHTFRMFACLCLYVHRANISSPIPKGSSKVALWNREFLSMHTFFFIYQENMCVCVFALDKPPRLKYLQFHLSRLYFDVCGDWEY